MFSSCVGLCYNFWFLFLVLWFLTVFCFYCEYFYFDIFIFCRVLGVFLCDGAGWPSGSNMAAAATRQRDALTPPVVKSLNNLTRNHAVRCENVEGIPVHRYVEAVGELAGDSNILAASRMNRSVIVFLNSVSLTDWVSLNGLDIGDQHISVEPLVRPSTKIVLSNVPPFLPDENIICALSAYGKVVSTVRTIPLGCKKPSLKHVKSFRRQVYVHLNDVTISGLLPVIFNGQKYNIYVSTDDLVCFNCHLPGHTRKSCPAASTNDMQINVNNVTQNSTQSSSPWPPRVNTNEALMATDVNTMEVTGVNDNNGEMNVNDTGKNKVTNLNNDKGTTDKLITKTVSNELNTLEKTVFLSLLRSSR